MSRVLQAISASACHLLRLLRNEQITASLKYA